MPAQPLRRTIGAMAPGSDPTRTAPVLLVWSLLGVLGVMLCTLLTVARSMGVRVAIEAAAGLVTLYCVMAGLLTAAQIAAMRAAARDDVEPPGNTR